MTQSTPPLAGKTALVTGVSRRRGIGFAVATRLAELGASIHVQHFSPHDDEQPWGSDDLNLVRSELQTALIPGARCSDSSIDLGNPDAPAELILQARILTGRLDILVCNQARSGGDGSIIDMTAAALDAHWSVNARATLLLTAEFARAFGGESQPGEARHPGELAEFGPRDEFAAGRVFWLTSGQGHGAMPGEVAYVASKAALAGATPTVALELLQLGIILNTINPGPVNTGYMDADTTDRSLDGLEEHLAKTPFGRFGAPTDPARLIGWLATDEGRWVVGQVLTSDGGFSL